MKRRTFLKMAAITPALPALKGPPFAVEEAPDHMTSAEIDLVTHMISEDISNMMARAVVRPGSPEDLLT